MNNLPDDVAIRVSRVYKNFRVPRHHDYSLKGRALSMFKEKDKGFDIHHALRGVDFEIKKGEFFGIIGRNGSGKSTLLKIISKIYQPTRGTASYRGKLVAFIELGVGFNPQLSGRENVYLNGAMLGFSRKEINEMFDEIVAFAELEEFMEQKLKNYSSGMKVRLAFSIAIRAKADILVLDEVLAVGDASFQRKCYDYFRNLKEEHKTIVLVSHNMGLIKEYCDKAALIEGGVVAHVGRADEVSNEYLKMFNDEEKSNSLNKNIESLQARIVSIEAVNNQIKRVKTYQIEDEIYIKITIETSEQVKTPVIAFSFRDQNGKTVMATNTKVLGITVADLQPGTMAITFKVDNIFTNMIYDVYATVFDSSMNKIISRILAGTSFSCSGRDPSNSNAIAHPKVELVK